MERVTKSFPGTVALDNVDFSVYAGEIHALLGENGAGKSTLIKSLAGLYPADSGTIVLRGERYEADRGRIAFIHQDLGLFPAYSVAENIAIVAGYGRGSGPLISWGSTEARARQLLASMGSGVDPAAPVASLSSAERSIVAIARALAVEADVLILDEPTATLPEPDVRRLFDVLHELRSRGMGIVFVTHRLDEVFRIADRVTVLRDGKRVWTGPIGSTDPGDLVRHIVGRDLTEVFVAPPEPSPETILEVSSLRVGLVGPVSFSLRRGEVLGLVGLRGAGQDKIGRALFGAAGQERIDGQIFLLGRAYVPSDPAVATQRGLGFVSSRRAEEGIAGPLTVRENLYPNPEPGRDRRFFIDPDVEKRRAYDVLNRFDVRPRDPERPVETLSGGNQQKVILARWLEAHARVLILEEPTFGVDIGAKAEIYRVIDRFVEQGNGVLLLSSDFEEVAGVAHRALVFYRGRIVAELARPDLSMARLTRHATGVEAAITG